VLQKMCHKITGEHNMMNKKGFTLIELMVVVVIIGILAAVAVPKLFGMIAKSKASEVGPAAGTYVKMQQAYISEAMAIGNWTIIGYKAPGGSTGTTNFTYGGFMTDGTGNTVSLETETVGWKAGNKAKLNDCGIADDNWSVTVKGTEGASEATFTSAVKNEGDSKCADLTPTFATIGG
jgi:prepilin-type N-terminal cleavage/methylation domain-containing protein